MKKVSISSSKGLSEAVSYALLIAIALSISLLVYAWLKSVTPGEAKSCPDGVSMILVDYQCGPTQNAKTINISFQNKGTFNISGFYLKASNSSGIPIKYLLNPAGENVDIIYLADFRPGAIQSRNYSYAPYNVLTKIEIEPFIITSKNESILCSQAAFTEEVNCP